MPRFFAAFWFLSALLPLSAATEDVAGVTRLYMRGLAGDKQAVIECIATLEKILAAEPENQLARVYLGSAETLRSRDLPFGPTKLSTLRRGIAHMDEAAAAAPNDGKVLLLRAITNEALPALLGRRQVARQALEELVTLVEKEPAKLSPGDRQSLFLTAGNAAKSAGDDQRARALWERGLALRADPKLQRELQTALATLN